MTAPSVRQPTWGFAGRPGTTTYDDDAWLVEQGIDIRPYLPVVDRAWDDGVWTCP